MYHQEHHTPAGVYSQPLHLEQGQFGDSRLINCDLNRTFHVSSTANGSFRPEDLEVLRGGNPASISAFLPSTAHRTAPHRQPINASFLNSPIMMLKTMKGFQTNPDQTGRSVQSQNVHGTGDTQFADTIDATMKCWQDNPSLSQYPPTGGCLVHGTGFALDSKGQSAYNANGGHFGQLVTGEPNICSNEEFISRHRQGCLSAEQGSQIPANTNSRLLPSSLQQIRYSTEADSIQYNIHSDPHSAQLCAQHLQSQMPPHRQDPWTQAHVMNNIKATFDPNSQRCPQDLDPRSTYHDGHFAGCGGVGLPTYTPGRLHYTPCQRPATGSCNNVTIYQQVKVEILESLRPGHVIQVCGPPLAGKSTLVKQAVKEAVSQYQPQLIQQHVHCKTASNLQDLLNLVARKMCPHRVLGLAPDEDSLLDAVVSVLQQNHPCRWVIVFHKCENLTEDPHRQQFVNFMARLAESQFSVTVVFTTYKYYWLPRNQFNKLITVGTMSIFDIISLLYSYSHGIDDIVGYAQVLSKNFCFPEAVRLITEEFIADETCRVSPEMLEKKINKDHRFMSQLFDSHLQEVPRWIPRNVLFFLTHFGHSVENSFTEAHLEYVNSLDLDKFDISKIISYLKQNHVVRSLPTINRLVIHPLAVYYMMTSTNRERQLLPEKLIFDKTFTRHTHFVGRILMSIEANTREHGRKGLVFGGLFEEWPNVRYIIQMALHCNTNTYENFIKVGVSASTFILKFFPKEAESFYLSLCKSAQDFNRPNDLAVMEALLGQAVAEGSGIAGGEGWSRADHYLTSAIHRLSAHPNSFFLGWALIRKAIVLHRQGKYDEAIRFFGQARIVLKNVDRLALGEAFSVSEARVEEEIITQEIHETIPYIFIGHNQLARQRLDHILDLIQNDFENHPELATLLNLVGLTEQRGNRNLERALMWYKLSYNERMLFAKMCPDKLLAVLNNIGMILLQQGKAEECIKYLNKALDIQREFGWTHYFTGLTLIHLAEVHMKIGEFAEAFQHALESERIFTATVKDHEVRVRVNFVLAHLRLGLRQALEDRQCSQWEGETSLGSRAGSERRNSQHFEASGGGACQVCPGNPVIVSVTTTRIEPCDLQKSAEDYLDIMSTVAASKGGTLGDDGLSLILSSLEHRLLLNLGNRVKFEEYKAAIIQFRQENPWIAENGATDDVGIDSRLRCLIKHTGIYLYIINTPYTDFNVTTFIEYMRNVCLKCMYASNIFTTEFWQNEFQHCKQRRERSGRLQQLNLMRVNPGSTSLRSEAARNINLGTETIILETPDEVPGSAVRNMTQVRDPVCPAAVRNMTQVRDPVCPAAVRNMTQVRDPVCPADVTPTGKTISSESQFPKFHHLISDSSSGNQYSAPLLHTVSYDGDIHRRTAPANVRAELEPQLPDNSICQQPISSRIANVQRHILEQFQNKRTLSQTVSVDTENQPSGAAANGGRTSRGTNINPSTYLPAPREPVEQSYNGDNDPDWNSDDSLSLLGGRELLERSCRERPVLDERQNSCLSSARERIRTVYVTDQPLQDDLSKPQLVLQQCRSIWTSHNDPFCENQTSTSESQTDATRTDTYKAVGHNKFSILEYLSREGFNENMARTDELETQTNGSDLDKSCYNVISCIQQIGRPSSEKHQIVSVKEVAVCDSNRPTNVDGGAILADTAVTLPVCTQRLQNESVSHPDNCSQFHCQHPDKKVIEPLSECVNTPPFLILKDSTEDPDGGPGSLPKRRSRGSGSESSNVSQRSRYGSTSSCSGRHGHPVGALTMESGYSSQGVRSRTCSITERSLGNLKMDTSHCTNPNTANLHCVKNQMKESIKNSHPNQGFSEIQNNITTNFHEESNCAYDRRQDVPSFCNRGDTKCQRSEKYSGNLPFSDPYLDNQATDLSKPLKSVGHGVEGRSFSIQEPVEQPCTNTPIPNEDQPKSEHATPQSELLNLDTTQGCQGPCQHLTEHDEEIL